MYRSKTIGVVIPAHNEAPAIGCVVRELLALTADTTAGIGPRLVDQLVVCDNASNDTTAQQARAAGALVVREERKGYGAACLRGIAALERVDVVVFVDGDHSVRASELPLLLDAHGSGADLVIGSRALGERAGLAEAGSQTPHQRAGNWIAGKLLSVLFGSPTTDLGPFRAIGSAALNALQMRDQAYGWTAEMQTRALAAGFKVQEVPVSSPRRIGTSKVSGTWRGSLGASVGILSTIFRIGIPALWAELSASTKIERSQKDTIWKKHS